MCSIKKVLMDRDGLTVKEAQAQITEAKVILKEYLEDGDMTAAEEICQEMFGLEPDYIFDLVD